VQAISVLALVVLLAGCITSGEGPASHPAPQPTASAPPKLVNITFHVTGTPTTFNQDPSGGYVDVAGSPKILLVETRAICDVSTACDLRLHLFDPAGKGVKNEAAKNGEGRLVFEGAAAGRWTAQVWPDAALVDARGEIRVTIFEGPVPEGYSAFTNADAHP
jgi:hypothetical protein